MENHTVVKQTVKKMKLKANLYQLLPLFSLKFFGGLEVTGLLASVRPINGVICLCQ